jgi:Recombination endonuclease VII
VNKTEQARLERAGLLSEKQCWRCKLVKPIDGFDWRTYRGRLMGRRAACKSCEDPEGTKRCRTCGWIKPKDEFYLIRMKRQPNNPVRAANCKPCQKAFLREWRLRKFSLSLEDYELLLKQQDGRCAVCSYFPETGEVLRVDHDHRCCPGNDYSCGKCIRGLLCDWCNLGLGNWLDDPVLLESAARYLRKERR